jgi:hypothetical protein
MTFESRDRTEVDALRTDRYLDALLAAAERHAIDVPADAAVDPAMRAAVRRLRLELVRVHPSFRFEERLARRLAETAARIKLSGAPYETTAAGRTLTADLGPVWHLDVDPGADPATPGAAARRALVVRGAFASAALGLAGAAIVVARRRARPGPPVPRAARAAYRAIGAGRSTRARRARLA